VNLLILGGTQFVGRAIARTALDRGHRVTLFHRGKTNADLFPEAEHVLGDRDGGLDGLSGRRWDAVCDVCGYVPRVVRQSVEALAGAAPSYAFISTVSVYADLSRPGTDESAALPPPPDPPTEEITPKTYGPLKAACEKEVAAFPGATLIVRPGLIVGPHDSTDRFTYWPVRVARGGEVAAPGAPDRRVQIVDVRDLAEWTVGRLEARAEGVFNATGPAGPLTLGEVLETCRDVAGADARFRWIPDGVLTAHEVKAFREMPLWLPAGQGMDGVLAVDSGRAIAEGLTFRPLADTVRDTLAWHRSRDPEPELTAGVTPEREAELLAAEAAAGPGSGAAPAESPRS
jgi:2'-hydroxyisoflavone reductase